MNKEYPLQLTIIHFLSTAPQKAQTCSDLKRSSVEDSERTVDGEESSEREDKPTGNGSVVENGDCTAPSPEKQEMHLGSNITTPAKTQRSPVCEEANQEGKAGKHSAET